MSKVEYIAIAIKYIIYGCCTWGIYWLFLYANRVILLMVVIGGLRKEVIWDKYHSLFFLIEFLIPLNATIRLSIHDYREQYGYVVAIFIYPIITFIIELILFWSLHMLHLDYTETDRFFVAIAMVISIFIGFFITDKIRGKIARR